MHADCPQEEANGGGLDDEDISNVYNSWDCTQCEQIQKRPIRRLNSMKTTDLSHLADGFVFGNNNNNNNNNNELLNEERNKERKKYFSYFVKL